MNRIAAYSLGSQVNLTIAHRATRSFNQVVRRGGFMQSIDQVTRMLPSTDTLFYPVPAHVFTCFTLPPPFKLHTSFVPPSAPTSSISPSQLYIFRSAIT